MVIWGYVVHPGSLDNVFYNVGSCNSHVLDGVILVKASYHKIKDFCSHTLDLFASFWN